MHTSTWYLSGYIFRDPAARYTVAATTAVAVESNSWIFRRSSLLLHKFEDNLRSTDSAIFVEGVRLQPGNEAGNKDRGRIHPYQDHEERLSAVSSKPKVISKKLFPSLGNFRRSPLLEEVTFPCSPREANVITASGKCPPFSSRLSVARSSLAKASVYGRRIKNGSDSAPNVTRGRSILTVHCFSLHGLDENTFLKFFPTFAKRQMKCFLDSGVLLFSRTGKRFENFTIPFGCLPKRRCVFDTGVQVRNLRADPIWEVNSVSTTNVSFMVNVTTILVSQKSLLV